MDWNSIMFDNIGIKIQKVAKVIVWIQIVLSIVIGIIMFIGGILNMDLWYFIFLAPVTVVVGCISAWLYVIILYGFGKLIEDVSGIRNQNASETLTPETTKPEPDKKRSRREKQEFAEYVPQFTTNNERWEYEISQLSTEEIKARYADTYEWSEAYRELCHKELRKRVNM